MKDHKAYNDQLFSRWAPIYDGFELILSDVRKKVVQQIKPNHKSVLDVATGTGSLAIDLSETAEKVIGIDLSAEMLEVAKRKKARAILLFSKWMPVKWILKTRNSILSPLVWDYMICL
jgi:ubiquinone/menaquinone biosynthesis C-methylase UbiE